MKKRIRPRRTPRFVVSVLAEVAQPATEFIVYTTSLEDAVSRIQSLGRRVCHTERAGHYDRKTNLIIEAEADTESDPKSGLREIIPSQIAPIVKSGPV